MSDRITSFGNLNVKSWNCITTLESLKDEFNLKAFDIKRNLILRIETVKDQATSIWKNMEPTFDQNLIETVNQHDEENE